MRNPFPDISALEQNMDELLDLSEITYGYYGLTEVYGAHLLEACIATLWLHNHRTHHKFTITGAFPRTFKIVYPEEKKTTQLANSWKDKKLATEKGAECIGILLALKLTKYEVIERAVQTTGIDFWIGNPDEGLLFQKKARLEVSGIFEGNDADIDSRFNNKIRQTEQSNDSLLPAYISVTEFSAPRSKFGKNERP